jgi:hypothetical protein
LIKIGQLGAGLSSQKVIKERKEWAGEIAKFDEKKDRKKGAKK